MTRKRRYGWPSEATIRQITLGGCDIVPVSHRECKHDTNQWRLSFSQAELMLLNSCIRVQQIVYHMLRTVAKKEFISRKYNKTNDEILCTFHIKTLVLWACEKKSPDWWNGSTLVAICRELLSTLLLMIERGNSVIIPHYLIKSANLFDYKLTEQKLTWVINAISKLLVHPTTHVIIIIMPIYIAP